MLNDGNMNQMQEMAERIKAAAQAAKNQINTDRQKNHFKVNAESQAFGARKYQPEANLPISGQNQGAAAAAGNLSGAAAAAQTVTINPFAPEWRKMYLDHCAKSYVKEVCEKLFDWSYFDHWLNSGVQLQEHGDIGILKDISGSLRKAAKTCNGVRKSKGTTGEDACIWQSINKYFHKNNDPDRIHMWLVRLRPWFDIVCAETWGKCSQDFHRIVTLPFSDIFRRYRIPLQGLHMIFRSFVIDCFNENESYGRSAFDNCMALRIQAYQKKLSDPNLAAMAFT